jgi:NADH:ubiquinone oxidoreductase subunit H
MSLGWRFLLPVSLGYIVLIATALLVLQMLGIQAGVLQSGILLVLNVAVLLVMFVVFDRGRLVSPTTRKMSGAEMLRLRMQDRAASSLPATARSAPEMGD